MIDTVGVVVVNFNGGDLTLDCLRSLGRTDWPAARLRVVLVDNASTDGVVARVRAELPAVEVIESPVNGGFGAACNLGIRGLTGVDAIALVNNDATVDPGWLAPLVAALDGDPALGAACPKILFAGKFEEIELRAETVRPGRGDRRDLGVLLAGARVDDVDVWNRAQLRDGFWGAEPHARSTGVAPPQWSAGVAHVRVPVGPAAAGSCSLLLSAERPTKVELRAASHLVQHVVDSTPRWISTRLAGMPVDVINNVGTVLTADGYGADRGYLEPDRGQYDDPVDVFAWCGGAVLMPRAYLDDVGLFDERLFLYYEDVELSWRGAERGWRYRTVPISVIRHVHAASSVDGSAFKRYYDERNHLIVLARHAPATDVAKAAVRSLLVTGSYARRDLVAPALSGRAPRGQVVQDRLRAFGGFARMLPDTVRDRRTREC